MFKKINYGDIWQFIRDHAGLLQGIWDIWYPLPPIHSSTVYQCKFGQNSSTGLDDNALKPYFGHFKVPMWP